jgi:hypothetical protein
MAEWNNLQNNNASSILWVEAIIDAFFLEPEVATTDFELNKKKLHAF